jgi:tRNA-specific adenosine deaminase 1
MWKVVAEVAGIVGLPMLIEATRELQAYSDLKNDECLAARRKVKHDIREALKGWVRNGGDDNFRISSEETTPTGQNH